MRIHPVSPTTGLPAIARVVLALAAIAPVAATAESVDSVPLGAVPITIAAGTGTARTLTPISFPLIEDAAVAGQSRGIITGITANTLSNSNAGWTAGQLSTAATPCLIQITSGAASGRIFLISTSTANSSTTVTIDAEEATIVDLTTLGIATGPTGDTYRILACDTISSIFGTPAQSGVIGGSTATTADTLQIMVSGAWRQYYYNTTSSAWLRVGPNSQSNNVPIRPDSLALFNRIAATPINFTWIGQIPSIDRKAIIRKSGITSLATGWPIDLTLASASIQTTPGWVSSTSATSADIVQVMVSGAWRQYYHNGTNWRRVGPNTISDTQIITAGGGLLINKKGSASGSDALPQTTPYSL